MSFESLKAVVARRLQQTGFFHGEPGTWTPQCERCTDAGWEVHKDDQGRLWARPCVCRGSGPTQLANAPQEFAGSRLDTFRRTSTNADVVARAEAWLPRGKDLFVWGPVGTGKTRLACALVQELHRPSRFELVDALLRTLVRDGLEGELWRELVAVPVLVLDDVGGTDSEWARRTLTTLYTERLDKGRRTVWTSNLSVKALVDAWDDSRLGSRIAGAADVLHLTGPDMRRHERPRGGD